MDYNHSIFFETNPSPIWIYELETLKIIDVNKAAVKRYGYSKSEFLSLTLDDLRDHNDTLILHDHLHNATLGYQKDGIWRHKSKDGSFFNVEITTETFEDNGKIYKIVYAREIDYFNNISNLTELWTTQFRNHLKRTPLSYIEWDKNLRSNNFSNDLLKKYHFTFNDLYNKTPSNLIPFAVTHEDADLIKNRMEELTTGNHTQSEFELKFYDKNNNIVHSKWYNSVLRDVNNNVISILSLIEDITQ